MRYVLARRCDDDGAFQPNWYKIGATVAFGFVLPIGILAGVPTAVAWRVVLASIPDYGYLLLVETLALLGIGLVKVGIVLARPLVGSTRAAVGSH